jgi:hypothetical protein
MNIYTHSALLDGVEDRGQMNTVFFVGKQNIPWFRLDFQQSVIAMDIILFFIL